MELLAKAEFESQTILYNKLKEMPASPIKSTGKQFLNGVLFPFSQKLPNQKTKFNFLSIVQQANIPRT